MPDDWQSIATLPPLGSGELQLWRIDLADATADSSSYLRHLDQAELDRAARLREGQVRMQFVVARACLRLLLANLVQGEPQVVAIRLGGHGKPETPAVDGRNIFFNVAHSRSTILIALCRDSKVGVDLEYLDRETDILEVARHAFTASEYRNLAEIDDPVLRRRAFFRCWTRKEAVIKSDGRGLSLPLTSFETPMDDADVRSLPVLLTDAGGQSCTSYYVSDIPLGEELAAAFAIELPECQVRRFNFPFGLA